jgi:hypothetical protein
MLHFQSRPNEADQVPPRIGGLFQPQTILDDSQPLKGILLSFSFTITVTERRRAWRMPSS